MGVIVGPLLFFFVVVLVVSVVNILKYKNKFGNLIYILILGILQFVLYYVIYYFTQDYGYFWLGLLVFVIIYPMFNLFLLIFSNKIIRMISAILSVTSILIIIATCIIFVVSVYEAPKIELKHPVEKTIIYE